MSCGKLFNFRAGGGGGTDLKAQSWAQSWLVFLFVLIASVEKKNLLSEAPDRIKSTKFVYIISPFLEQISMKEKYFSKFFSNIALLISNLGV